MPRWPVTQWSSFREGAGTTEANGASVFVTEEQIVSTTRKVLEWSINAPLMPHSQHDETDHGSHWSVHRGIEKYSGCMSIGTDVGSTANLMEACASNYYCSYCKANEHKASLLKWDSLKRSVKVGRNMRTLDNSPKCWSPSSDDAVLWLLNCKWRQYTAKSPSSPWRVQT